MVATPMRFIWIVAAVLVACGGRTGNSLENGDDDATQRPAKNGAMYYLDADTPMIAQPIAPGDIDSGAAYRFVQIEVADVVNPRMYVLTFEVHYQSDADGTTRLGSFTLYPSNRPGRFLIATQGTVRNKGTLILKLTSSDRIEHGVPLRVGVRRIRFVEG